MSNKVNFEWKQGVDLVWFIQRLNNTRTQKSNKVSYQGADSSYVQSVLHSYIQPSKPVSNSLVAAWLSTALFAPTKNGRVTASGLLNEVNNAASSYHRQPRKSYFLVTSLSYQNEPPVAWTTADEARVYLKFRSSQFPRIDTELTTIYRRLEWLQLPKNFPRFPTVAVKTSARSEDEALSCAMDALDLIRGLMNLVINQRTQVRWSSGIIQPVNKLRLGPLHTLRNSKGRLATSKFSYELEFVQPSLLVNLRNYKDEIRHVLRVYRSNHQNPLVLHARKGLLRYVRALDRRDWGVSFLELWGALEFLTLTQRDPYDVTIRRAAALGGTPFTAHQVLNHLRDVRNGIIHKFDDRPDSEMLMYQLKNFVEWLLRFYIHNPFRLKSLGETCEFLDLPHDVKILRRRQRLLLTGLNYRIGKSP